MAKVLSGAELDQHIENLYAERTKFDSLFQELKLEAVADLNKFRKKCLLETVTKPRVYSWLLGFAGLLVILLLAFSRVGLAAFIIVFRSYTNISSRFERDYYHSTITRQDHPNLFKFFDDCFAELKIKPIKEFALTVGSGLVITYEKKTYFSRPFPVLRIGILLMESLNEEQFREVVLNTLRKWRKGTDETLYKANDCLAYALWPSFQKLFTKNFYDKKALWRLHALLSALSSESSSQADKESMESGSRDFLLSAVLEPEKAVVDRCFYRAAKKMERGESDPQFAVFTYFEEFRILLQSPEYKKKCLGLAHSTQEFEHVSALLGDRLKNLNIEQDAVLNLLDEAISIKDRSAGDSILGSDVQNYLSEYINYRISLEQRSRDELRIRTDRLRSLESEYGPFETYAIHEMELFERENDLPFAIQLAEAYATKFPDCPMIQFELAKRLAKIYDVRAIEIALKALTLCPRLHESLGTFIKSVSLANGIPVSADIHKLLLKAEYLATKSEKPLVDKHFKSFENYIATPVEKAALRLLCLDCGLSEAYTLQKHLPDGTSQKFFIYVTLIGKKTPAQIQEKVLGSDYVLLDFHYFNLPPGNPLIVNQRKEPVCRIV